MKLRRTLALLGPLTAAAALLLPWYRDEYEGTAVRGWDLLTGMNWLLLAIVLAVAVPVLRARSSIARAASVAGGCALVMLGLRCLFVPWEHAGVEAVGRSVGPWVVLAAGVATVAAGRALHAREGDVATVRRLLAVLGPVVAVSALALPWFAYYESSNPFPLPAHADLGPWIESGFDELTTLDWLLITFGAAAAAAAVMARRELARGACVLCGVALVVLATVAAVTRAEFEFAQSMVLSGPFVTIAAGVATAVAGYFLYAPRRSASSLITAS